MFFIDSYITVQWIVSFKPVESSEQYFRSYIFMVYMASKLKLSFQFNAMIPEDSGARGKTLQVLSHSTGTLQIAPLIFL